MCFRAIRPQNRFLKKLLEKNSLFSTGGGQGYPSMENSMKIINFFLRNLPLELRRQIKQTHPLGSVRVLHQRIRGSGQNCLCSWGADLQIILGGLSQMSKSILQQYRTHTHYIYQIKKKFQKLSVNLQKILANLQNILLNLQKYQRISAEI